MKTKKLLIFIFLAICLFCLASCTLFTDKPYEQQEFFVSYGISSKWADKAEIVGDTDLFVKKGETGPTVTVVTKEGYRFVRWLDTGSTNPTRTDENIQHDIIAYALIEGYLAKSVIFMANKGGKIEGNPEQILVYGKQGETVTAVPDEDFRFVKWSDGRTEASRSDNNLSDWDEVQYDDLFVYAEFERYQRNFKFNYNDATSGNTEESVMITLDNISSLQLPVPARENYKFEGWFSDWHHTTRVSDADGKVTADKNWLQNEWLNTPALNNPPGNLYAKWTATGRVPKFKILMLFVTRIDVVLETAEGEKIKVDYTMSDIERKICTVEVLLFKNYLNAIFNATVDFEIDTIFTEIPITSSNNFIPVKMRKNGKLFYDYSLGLVHGPLGNGCQIEEVQDIVNNYGSVITTYCMNDFEYKLHCVAGSATRKYGAINFETVLHNEIPYELKFDDTIPGMYSTWEGDMEFYLHEFIHTIEMQADGTPIGFHDASKYYRDTIGPVASDFYFLGDFLTGNFDMNGEKIGIPYEFWVLNDSENNG